jgi:hypothetical protein
MRRRLYLHAGLHKTGTTSIQLALSKSRPALAGLGWLYPLAATPEWAPFGQHLLPWSVMRRESYLPLVHGRRPTFGSGDRDALWTSLRSEIDASGAENIILSSEEFDTLSREEIFNIADYLSVFDVHVMIFLRNHADFIESGYRTSVAYSGYTNDIRDFANNQRTRLDFLGLTGDWGAAFGVGRIELFDYDDPGVARDSVSAFFHRLGLDPAIIAAAARQRYNESLPAFGCELLRFLRLKGVDETQLTRVARMMLSLDFGPEANRDFALLPKELRAQLDAASQDQIAALTQDADLASRLPAGIGAPRPRAEPQVVTNIAEAMIAFLACLSRTSERARAAQRDRV